MLSTEFTNTYGDVGRVKNLRIFHPCVGFGIFIVFLEVCSLPDLANIADGSRPRQVLRHAASGFSLIL